MSQQLFGFKESLSKSWNGKSALRDVTEGQVIEDVGRIMTAGVPSASAVVSAFQSIRLHVQEIKFRFYVFGGKHIHGLGKKEWR